MRIKNIIFRIPLLPLFLVILAPAYALPSMTVNYPLQVYQNEQITISVTVGDISGGLQNIQIYREGFLKTTYICEDDFSCSFDWTTSESYIGYVDYEVTAYSYYGDSEATASKSFTIQILFNNLPSITSTPITSATEDQPYTYDVEAVDIDNHAITYSLTTAPSGMNINSNTGLITWTPMQAGQHNIAIKAIDELGKYVTQTYTLTVIAFNDAPIINGIIPDQAKDEDSGSWSLDLTAYESDEEDSGTALVWSVNSVDTSLFSAVMTDIDADILTFTPVANAFDSDKITLTLTDGGGKTDSQIITVTLNSINDAPTASANANPTSGVAPLTVQFTGSSSDIDGDTLTYSWDFGDSSISTEQNPTHTYLNEGTFQAKLTVTDGQATAEDIVIITVSSPPTITDLTPMAQVYASPSSGEAPLKVQFVASAISGNTPITYSWNFGDGSTSTEQNPIHTYNKLGTHTATLIVIDADGDSDTATAAITVKAKTTKYFSTGGGKSSRISRILPESAAEESEREIKETAGELEFSNYIEIKEGQEQRLDILLKNTGDRIAAYSVDIQGLEDYEIEPAAIILAPNKELTIYAYLTADKVGQRVATVSLKADSRLISSKALIINVSQESIIDIVLRYFRLMFLEI